MSSPGANSTAAVPPPSVPPAAPPAGTPSPPPSGGPRWVKKFVWAVLAVAVLAGLYWIGTTDERAAGPADDGSLPGLTDGPSASPTDGGVTVPGELLAAAETACSVPVYDDPYAGFAVGRPEGWAIEYADGVILVTEDPDQTIGVMVYPAKVEQNLTAREFVDAFGEAIGGVIRDAGGTFALSNYNESGQRASARAEAVLEGLPLVGTLSVETEPNFITMKLPFAPEALYEEKLPTLEAILSCFERKTVITDTAASGGQFTGQTASAGGAGLLRVHQGRWFKVSLPADWEVTSESERGIDVANQARTASVSFAYATGGFGSMTPTQWNSQTIPQAVGGASIQSNQDLPSPAEGWSAAQATFTGSLQGKTIQGVSRSWIWDLPGSYAVQQWLRVATPDTWPSIEPLLRRIEESIQITSTSGPLTAQQQAALPRNNPADTDSVMSSWENKMASDDRISNRYQEATMGFENVTSPSTGQAYQAPLNSYNSTGPEGPGYYRSIGSSGDYEKLEPVY